MARRTVASLLVFAVSVAIANPAAAACTRKLAAALAVEFGDHGEVLVPAKIDGRDVWMSLQLSNSLPLIAAEAVDSLGLVPIPENELMLASGRQVDSKVVVKSLRLDRADFGTWTFYVSPLRNGLLERDGKPVIGNLAARFLAGFDLELNLARKQVRLYGQTDEGCGKQVVYWVGEVTTVELFSDSAGLVLFPMEIDGKKVEASFDTSRAASQISEQVTGKFFGFNRHSSGITLRTNDDGTETASYRAMGLTAKGLSIRDVPLRLKDDLQLNCNPGWPPRTRGGPYIPVTRQNAIGFLDCSSVTPLSIGTDLLKQLRVYIAPGQEKAYFTRAEEPASGGGAARDAGRPVPAASGAAAAPSDGAGPAPGAVPGAPAR
jgi:hypothetical protein